MFERFTEEARSVLVEAQDVAVELGAGHISPGHILYGCAEARESTAGEPLQAAGITGESIRRLLGSDQLPVASIDAQALQAIGIDFEAVRTAVEATFGAGSLVSAPDRRARATKTRRPPFTPGAKRSLELSLRVAVELHGRAICPGHLLLGLLRLDDDFISSVIEQAGATVAGLSAVVLERVDIA
jgi:ATP-dependent Clp protease ATP-binding subunit ClpA